MSQPESDDPRTLFAVAVAYFDDVDASALGQPSDTKVWDAIFALQRTGSRAVLDLCAARFSSPDPRERRVAAAVLGQLGVGDRRASTVFRDERFQALHTLLLSEAAGPADACVLASACIALGHLHDSRAVPAVVALRGHPDPDVRYAVVHGLLGHDLDEAVAALIALSADATAQVRDWATFGLSQQIDRDTPTVRAALAARLIDADPDTRQEAFTGLAERGEVMLAHHLDLSPDETVEISISRPSQIGDGMWCCVYRLRWPDHEVRFRAYGLDGSQALLLAMALAHRSLLAEAAFRTVENPPPEAPAPTAIDWPGADALHLGQTGADDLRAHLFGRTVRNDLLDHIVLAECGSRFLKVARVAGAALHAIGHRSRSARLHGEIGDDEPDPLLDILLKRLVTLVERGALDVRGDPTFPRDSEIRLPVAGPGETAP